MRAPVVVSIAACLLGAYSCAATAAGAGSTPEQVVDAFHQALSKGDSNAALQLLSPTALIFEQGFIDHGRAEYAGPHIAADAEFARAVSYQVIARQTIRMGDSAACVLSQTHTSGRFQGNPIELDGSETMLLQRQGASWTISHIHWSAHPVDAPVAAMPNPDRKK